MTDFFLRIYEYLAKHRAICYGLLLALIFVFAVMGMSLDFKEDISEFIPLDDEEQQWLDVYQNMSSADKIVAVFQMKDSTEVDPNKLSEAARCFGNEVKDRNILLKDIMVQVDYDQFFRLRDFFYSNVPYFLTENDYERMDSIAEPSTIKELIRQDHEMLMFPTGSLLVDNMQKDPLGMFTPILAEMQAAGGDMTYDIYDEYVFTPDHKCCIIVMTSPYGSRETDNNTLLMSRLDSIATDMTAKYSDIKIGFVGAPVIAVANASRIKTDSLLAISLSLILIIVLLSRSVRNFRNICLIVLAVAFGWLFALAGLAVAYESVSIIVIGIASVIVGIAINYPLHYVVHLSHNNDTGGVLRDIASPLLIGNITTIGAFLCLVPLESPALKNLGFFSSLMLMGTMLFVLIFLPHLVSNKVKAESFSASTKTLTAAGRKWLLVIMFPLTLVFGYFSLYTSFDTNLQNINYVPKETSALMDEFQRMFKTEDGITLYNVSSGKGIEEAMRKNEKAVSTFRSMKESGQIDDFSSVDRFLPSLEEQERRISRWNIFWKEHKDVIMACIREQSAKDGFSPDAFKQFEDAVNRQYTAQDWDFFQPVTALFAGNIIIGDETSSIVSKIKLSSQDVEYVKNAIVSKFPDASVFSLSDVNNAISQTLSDDFNYIGFVCGCIVFLFLWISFGRFELSIISFLPMAISWVWILGLMQLLGMKFNIVNIILATFIFGQGDDYTIFMTEGLIYEYTYKRRLLASYVRSIVISALIMFIGIGTLIIAQHPALHSLAEVTIVGMASVVVMAYLLPPALYRWVTMSGEACRRTPITLKRIIYTGLSAFVFFLQIVSGLVSGFVLFVLRKKNSNTRDWFHDYMYNCFSFDMRHIPGVSVHIRNTNMENFEKGSIIICNHQSILDSMLMMMLTPKILIFSNTKVSSNPIIHYVYKFADFHTIEGGIESNMSNTEKFLTEGYNIVIFPEGQRNEGERISRFHKGAFYMAAKLHADILPIFIHGAGMIMPKHSALVNEGQITIEIGRRIKPNDNTFGTSYQERASLLCSYYREHYRALAKEIEKARYFRFAVRYKYMYRGHEAESRASQIISKYDCFTKWIDSFDGGKDVVIINGGQGEMGLFFAMTHPDVRVYNYEGDEKMYLVSANLSYLPTNLHIMPIDNFDEALLHSSAVYILHPSVKDEIKYNAYNPIYIR